MPVVDLPREKDAVEEAIRIIQENLDNEARNRHVTFLEPKDLCSAQKAKLVKEVRTVLHPRSRRNSGNLITRFFGNVSRFFGF